MSEESIIILQSKKINYVNNTFLKKYKTLIMQYHNIDPNEEYLIDSDEENGDAAEVSRVRSLLNQCGKICKSQKEAEQQVIDNKKKRWFLQQKIFQEYQSGDQQGEFYSSDKKSILELMQLNHREIKEKVYQI